VVVVIVVVLAGVVVVVVVVVSAVIDQLSEIVFVDTAIPVEFSPLHKNEVAPMEI